MQDEQERPYWIDEPEMKNGKVEFLPPKETKFWNGLIAKYLYVLKKDVKVSVVISAVHFPTSNIPIFYRCE